MTSETDEGSLDRLLVIVLDTLALVVLFHVVAHELSNEPQHPFDSHHLRPCKTLYCSQSRPFVFASVPAMPLDIDFLDLTSSRNNEDR